MFMPTMLPLNMSPSAKWKDGDAMCHARPGTRCRGHLVKKIKSESAKEAKLSKEYGDASDAVDSTVEGTPEHEKALATESEAHRKLVKAHARVYNLRKEVLETPEGQRGLRDTIVDPEVGASRRDRALELYVQARISSSSRSRYDHASAMLDKSGENVSGNSVVVEGEGVFTINGNTHGRTTPKTIRLSTHHFEGNGMIVSSETSFESNPNGGNMIVSSSRYSASSDDGPKYKVNFYPQRGELELEGPRGRGERSAKGEIEWDTSSPDFQEKGTMTARVKLPKSHAACEPYITQTVTDSGVADSVTFEYSD